MSGRARAVGFAALLVAAGCTSGGTAAVRYPSSPWAVSRTPVRPLMAVPPSGWHVADTRLRDVTVRDRYQWVFQPDGATPRSGPAIVIGFIGDDQDVPACFGPRRAARAPVGRVARWGDGFSMFRTRRPSFYTSDDSYVFGRDVSSDTLRRVAAGVDWGDGSTSPASHLPSGFRLRATGALPAAGGPWIASSALADGSHGYVRVGEEAGNEAAVYLARVWKSLSDRHPCGGRVIRTVIRGRSIASVSATDTARNRRAVERIAARLRHVARRRFCEFDSAVDEASNACE